MYDLVYQRVDGYVNSKPILLAEIKRGNLPFKLVGEPLVIEEVGFPFEKNEKGEKLSQEFNQAIQKLKENGTLKSLSIKYYGEDITEPSKYNTLPLFLKGWVQAVILDEIFTR